MNQTRRSLIKGGLAVASIRNIHQTITCCPTLFESNDDSKRLGYAIGIGGEKQIYENVSISLEALYAGFPGHVGHDVGPNAIGPQSSRVDLKNNVSTMNVALNYHF